MTDDLETIEAEVVEALSNLPAVRASDAVVARGEITVEDVVAQREKIVQVMNAVMREGVHYGNIPGINKPTLFKPGAEVINVSLRLAPHYESEKIWHDDGHLTVSVVCKLQHIPTGLVIATGEGLCTTRESKYAYRQGSRECPECGAGAIKRSKYPPREADYEGASRSDPPGWYCYSKIGGCGWNFAHDDARIVAQIEGKVPNPDLPDAYNTVLKMADKRALIAAVLNGTAASDVFTQDAEDAATGSAPRETVAEIFGEPDLVREFDPTKNLLEEAPRGRENVAAAMNGLDPSMDWRDLVEQACHATYEVLDWRDLPPAVQHEFWVRLANAVGWVLREEGDGDIPPATEEGIIKGFAYSFDGATFTPRWLGENEQEELQEVDEEE